MPCFVHDDHYPIRRAQPRPRWWVALGRSRVTRRRLFSLQTGLDVWLRRGDMADEHCGRCLLLNKGIHQGLGPISERWRHSYRTVLGGLVAHGLVASPVCDIRHSRAEQIWWRARGHTYKGHIAGITAIRKAHLISFAGRGGGWVIQAYGMVRRSWAGHRVKVKARSLI